MERGKNLTRQTGTVLKESWEEEKRRLQKETCRQKEARHRGSCDERHSV